MLRRSSMAAKLRPRSPGLTQAIVAAGGVMALARKLGIDPASVSRWDRVPSYRVAEVERITGVSREVLAEAQPQTDEQLAAEADYRELAKLDMTEDEFRSAAFVFVMAYKALKRKDGD